MMRVIGRALLRLLGVRMRYRGPVPPRGALLVANHFSWLDIVVAAASWRCTFIAKREVGTWPIVGSLARALGVVFIDRTRPRDLLRVIPEVEAALARGERVLLFAEATTSRGQSVLPFRTALFEAAVRAGAPVFPVAVHASAQRGDIDALAWYGDESLVRNIGRVARVGGAQFTLHVGAPLTPGADRKWLAARTRTEVVRRFQPLAYTAIGARSVLLKQNLRPIDSSEREILV